MEADRRVPNQPQLYEEPPRPRRHPRGIAYDQNLYTLHTTRQVGRFGFCRVRADFDSLQSRIHGQVLAGWTQNPGTAIYLGYDNDMRRKRFRPAHGCT